MVRAPITYDPDPDEAVSVAVARALADARNECATQLTPRLYDAFDPDALDALFDGARTDQPGPRVSVPFDGYRVDVDGSRRVFVTELAASRSESPPPRNPGVLRGAETPWRLVFDQL